MSSPTPSIVAATGPGHGETSRQTHGATSSQNIGAAPHAMPLEVVEASHDERDLKKPMTFPDLPAEIRNKIWHAALAPRIVMIYPYDGRTETDALNQVDWNKIPGMLFANRESRRIALNHYDQRFTLTFTKVVPSEEEGVMCRLPIMMSNHDELAFSAHHLSSRVDPSGIIRISVEAAEGAPEPYFQRLSILGDSLMREGINEEHLTQLLNPEARAWDVTDHVPYDLELPWTIRWSPFGGKQPDLRELGPYLEDVEDVCIQFDYSLEARCLEDWLHGSLNSWYSCSIHVMDRDGVDAFVMEMPSPALPDTDSE